MILSFSRATLANGGGKAANLGELARAGFDVPDGFVVDADTYRSVVAELDIPALLTKGPQAVRAAIEQQPLPEGLRDEIGARLAAWGEGVAVAVRSSATAEDLPDASFAGQQDTYLGIVGIDGVLNAVRRCWASLWTDRATVYRDRAGFAHADVALAVVVQRLVDADVAGVLFTHDPVTGASEPLINASWGLGESVVSGSVTPDEYRLDSADRVQVAVGTKQTRIDRTAATTTTTTAVDDEHRAGRCLTDDQVRELAAVGARVAEHFGRPMDLEWAYQDQRAWLLQARPITTIGDQVTTPPDEKSTPAAQAPRTVTGRRAGRLSQTFHHDLVEHYPGPYPLDVSAIIRLHRQLQHGMAAIGIDSTPIDELLRVEDDGTVRLAYPDVRIGAGILRVFALHRPDPAGWPAAEHAYRRRLAGLAAETQAADGLETVNLFALLDRILDTVDEIARTRFLDYVGPAMIDGAKLAALLRLAGRGELNQYDLLGDLPFITAVIDADLHRLAALDRDDPDYGIALADFLSAHGARTTKLYLPFSNRSWREDSTTLRATLDALRRTTSSPRVAASHEQLAAEITAALPRPLRGLFTRTLRAWRAGHLAREASVYLIEDTYIQARAVTDEMARRLHRIGALDNPADIRFLTLEEVRHALSGQSGTDRTRELVQERRNHRPRAAAAWWQSTTAQQDDAIHGTPGSPGVVTGPARLISGPEDFHRLQPGDVLVCQYTDPSWTPLFSLAAAVVADTGGQLSHAAIVAREYAIPAVMGTQIATTTLTDGQTITVNGDAGTVTHTRT